MNTEQPDKTVREKNNQVGIWVNCSDRLPDNSRDVFCKDEKGLKYVAYYTNGGEKMVDYEFWEDIPSWVTDDKDNRIMTINAGWYEGCEDVNYDYLAFPRNIVEWLDESQPTEPSIPVSRVIELLAEYKNDQLNPKNIKLYEPDLWKRMFVLAEKWLTNNNISK